MRDFLLPSFSDKKALFCFVWFGWFLSISIFGDGGVGFELARYCYLNMGVKLVMVKDQSLARCSVC